MRHDETGSGGNRAGGTNEAGLALKHCHTDWDVRNPLDRPIFWTEFKTVAAQEKFEHTESLRELKARIERTTKKAKGSCPWFGGKRFGDLRSPKNSLKTDANVLGITALEADYDGNRSPRPISPEQAVAALLLLWLDPRQTSRQSIPSGWVEIYR